MKSTEHFSAARKSVQSMTGYAAVASEVEFGSIAVEIRSVNSRFLDLVFRLPDELRTLEPILRERLTTAIQRGKVECRISLTRVARQDRPAVVNDGLLEQLLQAAAQIRARIPDSPPMAIADLMRWPGLLGDVGNDKFDASQTLPAFELAVEEFLNSRTREGGKLVTMMLDRLLSLEQLVAGLAPKVPQLLELYSDKLADRLRNALLDAGAGAGVPVDEIMARVRQEVIVYALKIDVAEELSRLAAHASEMHRVLNAGGSVGKRLDFLMQEFNREANTLGSKGLDLEVSRTAVDLKILIEQMREQIQNLE